MWVSYICLRLGCARDMSLQCVHGDACVSTGGKMSVGCAQALCAWVCKRGMSR